MAEINRKKDDEQKRAMVAGRREEREASPCAFTATLLTADERKKVAGEEEGPVQRML